MCVCVCRPHSDDMAHFFWNRKIKDFAILVKHCDGVHFNTAKIPINLQFVTALTSKNANSMQFGFHSSKSHINCDWFGLMLFFAAPFHRFNHGWTEFGKTEFIRSFLLKWKMKLLAFTRDQYTEERSRDRICGKSQRKIPVSINIVSIFLSLSLLRNFSLSLSPSLLLSHPLPCQSNAEHCVNTLLQQEQNKHRLGIR